MKKIASIAFLTVMIMLGSCKKFLEVPPVTAIRAEDFYKSAKDMTGAMASLYGNFQQAMVGESQFNNKYTMWGEARSDNFERGGNSNSTYAELQLNGLTAGNPFSDWSSMFKVINIANLNLKYFPGIAKTEINPALVTPLIINDNIAQSRALRAMAYFYIVRTWGDAPIKLTPFEDATLDAKQARDGVDKIFDTVIIPDLEFAYNNVNTANYSVFKFSRGAACAALMDVYMWRKDYVNAKKWFTLLGTAKAPAKATYGGTAITDLEPTANWNKMFTDPSNSIEAIWNIHWDNVVNGCPCMAGVSTSPNNSPLVIDYGIFYDWPLKYPTDIRHRATYDIAKTDARDRVWKFYKGTGTIGTTTYTVAAADRDANNSVVYLSMYRLADIYLLYAELLNKTGDKTNSLKYLNFIRTRAMIPVYTTSSPEVSVTPGVLDETKLEDAIIQERQYELFAEGKRWFDLVRTDRVIQVMDPIIKARQVRAGVLPADATGFGTDKRKYLWPLNRNVLNSNSLLTQNAPYTD
ncbi:RagB/SusD family nutrient uptake outer membrane protein [Pedobacter boryungensis]|uniref:RagB/SusD family nutrient uptake outer membrane protein n=1 Tax=Pedobacter boryungensis TaxID=869962 RepID=A0ABX2DDI2_9SPHI|nr:RagB/SusD family nutrient uptake outer membrane protein [Pedobacter boryungensis]NQX31031.1 RagB/SusD family nutrient uptake outer membrane protein [Pedobacter boryungensis]